MPERLKYPWQDEILEEKFGSILRCLGPDQARVVSIEKTDNGYRFSEVCDGYFGVTLNQGQFERFITELKKLAAS